MAWLLYDHISNFWELQLNCCTTVKQSNLWLSFSYHMVVLYNKCFLYTTPNSKKGSIMLWLKERQAEDAKMHLLNVEITKQQLTMADVQLHVYKKYFPGEYFIRCTMMMHQIPCINFSSGPRYIREPCAQKALCPSSLILRFTFLHWGVNP